MTYVHAKYIENTMQVSDIIKFIRQGLGKMEGEAPLNAQKQNVDGWTDRLVQHLMPFCHSMHGGGIKTSTSS